MKVNNRFELTVLLLMLLMLAGCFQTHDSFHDDAPVDPAQVAAHKGEAVVLVHGLGGNENSMASLETYLSRRGYQTVKVIYPSTKECIEDIAADYLAPAVADLQRRGVRHIHIVTHSMGGIVARYYLQDHPLPAGSRVVMISPPNQGVEIADKLHDSSLAQAALGPAVQQLGCHTLPAFKPLKMAVGVIAGCGGLAPEHSPLTPGVDDGIVSVAAARLGEMRDFLVVPLDHVSIKHDPRVISQVSYFLGHGRFKHPGVRVGTAPDHPADYNSEVKTCPSSSVSQRS